MNIFLWNFCRFTISFAFSSAIIMCIPIKEDFVIQETTNTHYEKLGWIINTINNTPELFEEGIICYGSSMVLNGINDSLFSKSCPHLINFGVPHPSLDLAILLSCRVHEKAIPQKEIFFVSHHEYNHPHNLIPYLTTLPEAISLYYDFYTLEDWFIYCVKRLSNACDFFFSSLTNKNQNHEQALREFGFLGLDRTIKSERFIELQSSINSERDKTLNLLFEETIHQHSGHFELMPIPSLLSLTNGLHNESITKKLLHQDLWADDIHLNIRGAKIFSEHTYNELKFDYEYPFWSSPAQD